MSFYTKRACFVGSNYYDGCECCKLLWCTITLQRLYTIHQITLADPGFDLRKTWTLSAGVGITERVDGLKYTSFFEKKRTYSGE